MYPDMKPCDSAMNEKTGHDGIFWVHENDIDKYVDIYNICVLPLQYKIQEGGIYEILFNV